MLKWYTVIARASPNAAVAQSVERHIGNVEVTGSIPVSSSLKRESHETFLSHDSFFVQKNPVANFTLIDIMDLASFCLWSKDMRGRKRYLGISVFTGIFFLLTLGIGLAFFYNARELQQEQEKLYKARYAMIVEDRKTPFWQSAYEGARQEGANRDILVELAGTELSKDYSMADLMRIAIYSKVDGIILEADESREMTALINEAVAQGINVVTIYSDNAQSDRCSFVGVGGYKLGQEYGREVLKCAVEGETLKVAVLVSSTANDTGQNILYSGIQDTVDRRENKDAQIELSLVQVDNTNAFSVEESIRDLFMEEELPDVIVCLDELNTTCTYQAVVDYNKVGLVKILGYYESDTILKAIERKVIGATLTVNTEQMGRYCVKALTEYREIGTTSQYSTVDVKMIDNSNVSQYVVDAHAK